MSQLIFVALAVTLGYFLLRKLQDHPTDRPTIEIFSRQYSLRVISVTRLKSLLLPFRLAISSTPNRRWVSGTARVYEVAVVDSEGNHGSVLVAFDPKFSSEMGVLDSHGLVLVPPSAQ
jgi:hypothetical protein